MHRRLSTMGSATFPSSSAGGGGTATGASGSGTVTPPGECWDSLSYLESAFHHGFMRSRLPAGDFVYYENPRVTRELDEFCDVDAMHQPKGPIILLGESGVGKSTFLANWLVRRKKMFQNWQSNFPEFIFYHVVGCSRQSLYVSNLLERILREMKEYFELQKEIPDVEERLSWQFPRFLEAASKKGRIILIIDGLQRLRTTDGESILKWVPLVFPPNVRLIFSGTVSNPATKYMRMDTNLTGHASPSRPGIQSLDHFERPSMNAQLIERIKLEANRRKWTLVNVAPLLEEERLRVVRKFIHKFLPTFTVHWHHAPRLSPGLDSGQAKGLLAVYGLQLFDLQQRAIASVPSGAVPHFLKTLLVALAWAVNEGFDIHAVLEGWLVADSQAQLLESILRTMEVGYTPTDKAKADARQFLHENRSTLAADAANRRSVGSSSPEKQHASYVARSSGSVSPERTQFVIPEYSQRGARSRTNMELPFDEVLHDSDSVDKPAYRRHNSQHETSEVLVSLRPEAAKNVVASIPALPVTAAAAVSGSATPVNLTLTETSFPLKPRPGSSTAESKSCDKVLSRTSMDSMPPYLTGGLYVSPLGDLLGRALSLLYVSRHGLLEKELKFILNAVVTEERQLTESTTKLHRKASFSNVKNLSTENPTAFSDADWKALLRALKPLGILSVQDVLVLPTCKESLRDVVWWRYIGSERAEQQYHQWLIRFFRIHPTTFRRVEELPWHLKRCYQWDTLRNVLVNLPMFQLLYTANYKNELFGYWKLLMDGPLPLYSATDATSCEQLTYAVAFDVVKEYGKSVEDWYKAAKPTTKVFTAMLQLVTKFMFEFSTSYQGFLPVFNHSTFDLKKLHADGFLFAEDLPHVHHLTTSLSSAAASGALLHLNTAASPMAMSAAATAASALNAALEAFPTLTQQATANVIQKDKESNGNWFYYYQRWIWIQYPWLALGRDIVIKENHVEMPLLLRNLKVGLGSSSLSGLSSGSTTSPDAGIMSPLASLDIGDHGDEEAQRGDVSTFNSNTPGSVLALPSKSQVRSLQFDQRFWDVKRSMFDPVHQRQKGTVSPVKVRGLQGASALNGPMPTIQTESIISLDNLFHKKATYAAVKTVLASSVRTLPGGIFSASSPALATVPELDKIPNSSTTFLTETGVTADEKHVGPLDIISPSAGSGLPLAKTGIGSLDHTLMDQLASMDNGAPLSTAFGLPAHFQDYPQSEWDLRKSYNYELVLKLQALYDNTKLEVKKKQSHLQSVKQKIAETQRRYEFTMRECEMAKSAITEMQLRMDKIENMLKQIDKQERTHRKLLRSCELFPPTEPAYFETLKKQLRVLQMKLKDVTEEKKMLEAKKTHLQTVEVPILTREIEKNKQLTSAVVAKLERARAKMAEDQAATEKLYERRLELIDNVRTTVVSKQLGNAANGLEHATHPAAQHTASASTRSLAAKVALQQCEAMCEKIQKATGFSKLELILEKFVSREELNRSFEEQAKVYEARLKQIKLHQAELEQQLHALEMSNAATSTEDPRLLEERLRVAEVELTRTERTQSVLLTTSKEVIAGASRIVKLVGITSCRTPHQNAIPAIQLWPPSTTGESVLLSEFETLDAKEITNLLQICQDRASQLLDVIEGGRADPDANFATMPSRGRRHKATRMLDDLPAKPVGRTKRQSHSGVKKDRVAAERGSVLGGAAFLSAGGSIGLPMQADESDITASMHELPGTPEVDEDEKNLNVVTRDAVKLASKARLNQKKRTKDVHAAPLDSDHD